MTFETIQEETTDKKHFFRRMNNGDLQIAEIYFAETNSLDFVVMYFKYDQNNKKEIEDKIAKYRKNGGTIIIGCAKNTECLVFKSLFDIYINSACDCDYENLVDFCVSTEDSIVHIDPYDFKSESGTEVFVVSEKTESIEKMIANLKSSTQKIMEQSGWKKFPKVVISFMTNGRNLLLPEVEMILKSINEHFTEDSQCMLNVCQSMKNLKENEIKVTMIFFENRTKSYCCKG